MEYKSHEPNIWCLFRKAGDGYTFSCEILIGIFIEKQDAEDALTEITTKCNFTLKYNNEYEIRPYFLNEIDWNVAV